MVVSHSPGQALVYSTSAVAGQGGKYRNTACGLFAMVIVQSLDRAAQVYLGNAGAFLENGVDADWKGELRMEIK